MGSPPWGFLFRGGCLGKGGPGGRTKAGGGGARENFRPADGRSGRVLPVTKLGNQVTPEVPTSVKLLFSG